VQLQGRLLGFRTFIKEAEYDKIKELVDQDPEYFFNILPYAQVLGLTTQWTNHFLKLDLQQPSWYSSYRPGDAFTTYMWVHRRHCRKWKL
ncbi:MAG: hypothetical protein IIT72_07695, partial [Lachnospiraceae bacterium]|nr:hypothetical protein [Lachnospiraceae bacterium]